MTHGPERRAHRIVLPAGALLALMLPMVATAATAGGPEAYSAFSWARFLAPFHMVVLHYPIGFVTLAALLEIWAWRRPSEGLRQVIHFVLTLTVIASLATIVFGLLRAKGGEYDRDTLGTHQWWGIAAGSIALLCWLLQSPYRNTVRTGPGLQAYRVLLVFGLGALVLAGHQGGSLTHGQSFLTENAPARIRRLLAATATAAQPVDPGLGATLYTPVRDVLDRKCVACHGPEKQKGRLRLDDPASMLGEGSSGERAILPGDPGGSYALQLALLPRHHDDAMPPEGKEGLTDDELLALVKWIQAGAPFPAQ